MKRLFSSFFCFSFFCLTTFYSVAAVNTSPVASKIEPLAKKSLLLDIVLVGKSHLVAVGQQGDILLSNDAIHWQQASVPVQTTLTGVYFFDELHGWAVGHDATILHTKDGGLTWHIQQYLPKKQKPLFDITFKDKLHGVAVGAYGLFYRTNNGGKSWKSEFHQEFLGPDDVQYLAELKKKDENAYLDEISSILPHFNRVIQDGRTLYMVGEMGVIAKSNNFGRHWQKFPEIYQGSFFDLARTQLGNLLVVGLRGHIFRSLENGTPWLKVSSGTTALLNSIVLTDDNRIVVLGNNGVLLVSSDDGVSYKKEMQADGNPLIAGVWFNHQIVAVSDVGIKIIKVK